ncbi:reverse transcriptase domain-containing protein [Desulfosporosinus sp. I2]|uniref:reverse transcriptase domain-containing protein n=1 Tax=Desulfosporosinus sp. I2 TaxID=1617025 RepID=UPI000A3E4898|nr:reverse transcriptase domain-containing protein [Desulfosporosinus sp. I2]
MKSLEEQSCNKEYKYERLYRNLYNPEFYLLAYNNIAKSQGSMTAGADGLTLDDMSMARINKIISSLKNHSYQPNPARREYITKKNSDKKRPLGIPSTDDKLIQEVVRMILEAMYEPTFSDKSHGFRPKRSCHTALLSVKANFQRCKVDY